MEALKQGGDLLVEQEDISDGEASGHLHVQRTARQSASGNNPTPPTPKPKDKPAPKPKREKSDSIAAVIEGLDAGIREKKRHDEKSESAQAGAHLATAESF